MVASRSRKTTGRRALGSGRRHLREPGLQGGFDHCGGNLGHAAMIGGAAAQKAWAAVRLLLDDANAWSDRCCAIGVGGSGDINYGKADGGGNVHRAGVVTEKKVTLRKEAGELGDGSFAGEVDGRAPQGTGDGAGNGSFTRSSEENDVGIVAGEEIVQCGSETVRRPAFGGAVRCAGTDGNAHGVGSRAGFDDGLHR